ncbi:glycoside hydrolase family 15 protein [candidate division KSB1 bacterium]|nr:glycoside hydrolase family 15 protein [candidate division KSB1 bacterium]
MAYYPIEDYGVIGNLHTVALVGEHGSVDWYCYPHFDSPSIFASILDDEKGGSFHISPINGNITYKQFYWPDTNVLVSRFLAPDGVAEIIDFMPTCEDAVSTNCHMLIRKLKVVRGTLKFDVRCQPAFDYARADHRMEIYGKNVVFNADQASMLLVSDIDFTSHKNGAVAEITLHEGEQASFVLMEGTVETAKTIRIDYLNTDSLLFETIRYWRAWISHTSYSGRWREMVHRAALVLKLLTFKPTGAIIAAPTTSLPETLGGVRNWDYRFTWIRDSAYTLYGLMRIGFTEEAASFMHWLEQRCEEMNPDGSIQIMYGINGEHQLDEQILSHLKGYRNSSPVRIGNGAFNQLQLDIYGELLDTIYLYNKYGEPISYRLWMYVSKMLDYVCKHWRQPDEGIWEVRGGRRQFVYSLLMCWVALDRGIRLAQKRSFPGPLNRWASVRDKIYIKIMTDGWSSERNAFVQSIGSHTLDASNLIMPLVFFLSPTDPRMIQTIDAINRSPDEGGLVSDSLVFRYDVNEAIDGLHGDEGTFNMCSFWLIEALTRAGRFDRTRLDEARFRFNKMLSYANHLGLYSEELGPCGEALGNFPQAFTHLSLISAAYNLDKALGK